MNSETFVYWLQGFVEIANTDTISEKQWQIIKDHLKLVFDKKTPDRTQEELNYISRVTSPSTPLPTDYKKLSDLIGKEFEWNKDLKPPYTITCGVDLKPNFIC